MEAQNVDLQNKFEHDDASALNLSGSFYDKNTAETAGASVWSKIKNVISGDSHIEKPIKMISDAKNEKVDKDLNTLKYWENKLANETLIESPQNNNCEISVVVPVYNEELSLIKRQIEAFQKQSINADKFEIIYVINNAPNASLDVLRRNEEIIKYVQTSDFQNIHIIDKSTKGNEIKECNVGKARNRGVAEATYRFNENKRNGIIIQTDADAYPNTDSYFDEIIKKFKNKKVIGISGDIIFEASKEDYPDIPEKDFETVLNKFILYLKFNRIVDAYKNPEAFESDGKLNFSGANMISRSRETIDIGGVPEVGGGEDNAFGNGLKRFSDEFGYEVLSEKENKEIKMITKLRPSDRTDLSFSSIFEKIKGGGKMLVEHPLNSNSIELTEISYENIKQNLLTHNPSLNQTIQATEKYALNIRQNKLAQKGKRIEFPSSEESYSLAA